MSNRDFTISDELRTKFELYMDINGIDAVHILEINESILQVSYAFRNRADAFDCVERAARVFYEGLMSADGVEKELQRIREVVEDNLFAYHKDPSLWGKPIQVKDMRRTDALTEGCQLAPHITCGNKSAGVFGGVSCAKCVFNGSNDKE